MRAEHRWGWFLTVVLGTGILAGWWLLSERKDEATPGVSVPEPASPLLGSPAASLPVRSPSLLPHHAQAEGDGPHRSASADESDLAPAGAGDAAVVLGAELFLHVRDRSSRMDLIGVEVRCVSRSRQQAQWTVPEDDAPTITIAREAVSPLILRPWRRRDDVPDTVRGFRMAGSVAESHDLAEPVAGPRGLRVFARAEGYGWGSLDLDPSSGGEREVLLDPCGSIEVLLSNLRLEEYASLEKEPVLVLARTGDKEVGQLIRLREGDPNNPWTFEALTVGRYRLAVELRDRWHASGEPLASEEMDLRAGEHRQIYLDLADPPLPASTARLEGTLTFPQFPGEDAVVIRCHPTATSKGAGQGDPVVTLEQMERVGDSRTWRWSAGEQPVGRYQLKVWPFQESFLVELQPRSAEFELVVPELAEVVVETLDVGSRERVPFERLFWVVDRREEGMVNFMGTSVPSAGEAGRFRFYTTPGRIMIRAFGEGPSKRYAERTDRHQVGLGLNELAVEMHPFCGLRVTLRVGEAALPVGSQPYLDLHVRSLDGEGHVIVDMLRTEGLLELSEPGQYEVSFKSLSPEYRPVSPRQVEIRPGEVTELEIDLERQ